MKRYRKQNKHNGYSIATKHVTFEMTAGLSSHIILGNTLGMCKLH